jgi:hypothetical protein
MDIYKSPGDSRIPPSETDELISNHSSDTSFDRQHDDPAPSDWVFDPCKYEGRVAILCEYSSRTKFSRTLVVVSMPFYSK